MRFALLFTVAMMLAIAACVGVGFAIYSANQVAPAVQEVVHDVVKRQVTRELLVFGGDWCEPCVRMKPTIERVHAHYPVRHIDPHHDSHSEEEAKAWGVTDCPTQIAVDNDNGIRHEVNRIVGLTTFEALQRMLDTGEAEREPTQVLEEPKPEPKPEPRRTFRSIVQLKDSGSSGNAIEPEHPNVGADGWRLRLFYPPGNQQGAKLAEALGRMTNVAAKYGFEADTTDSERFTKSWKPFGYPRDKVTIVLVRDNNDIAYYQHEFPADVKQMRDDIRAAAAGKSMLCDAYEREIRPTREKVKER